MNDIEKFKIFKDACQHWIDKLNLNHVEFAFVLCDDLEDMVAAASYDFSGHKGYIQLADDVNDKGEIEAAARHEILEVFLMPMKLQCINLNDEYHPFVQKETHAVIHILEKLL